MLGMKVPPKGGADAPEGINHSTSDKDVAEGIARQSGNKDILYERQLESAARITVGSKHARKCVLPIFMCSRLSADP